MVAWNKTRRFAIPSLLSQAGFTLLETLIAITIMTLAFASILMVQSNAIQSSARAKQMNVVAMLAKNVMVQSELEIEGKTFDEVKKEHTEQFKEPFQDYTWTRIIKEIEFPSLGASGGGGGGANGGGASDDAGQDQMSEQLTKLVTQFFSKAVREVTVTVSWKQGKGEKSFSLSTYWVDLNHEFQLSL